MPDAGSPYTARRATVPPQQATPAVPAANGLVIALGLCNAIIALLIALAMFLPMHDRDFDEWPAWLIRIATAGVMVLWIVANLRSVLANAAWSQALWVGYVSTAPMVLIGAGFAVIVTVGKSEFMEEPAYIIASAGFTLFTFYLTLCAVVWHRWAHQLREAEFFTPR